MSSELPHLVVAAEAPQVAGLVSLQQYWPAPHAKRAPLGLVPPHTTSPGFCVEPQIRVIAWAGVTAVKSIATIRNANVAVSFGHHLRSRILELSS